MPPLFSTFSSSAWLARGTVGLLAAGCLVTGSPAFGQSFASVTNYSTGSNTQPHDVAVGDVNADGRPDIAVTNYALGTVGVFLGQGSGAFGGYTTYSSGGNDTRRVAMGDLNGDGRADIVVANYGSASIGVLLALPGGGFGAVTTFPAGSNPYDVALGDLNGDGRLDAVTANQNGTSDVSVLLGQAGGTFAPRVPYGAGGNFTVGIALADLDGNGSKDIITANEIGSVGVLTNQGAGTFNPAATYSTGSGSQPYGVAAGDVNGDGRPDIVAALFGSGKVGVLPALVGGSFGAVSSYGSQISWEVALADLNSDGRLDIIGTGNGYAGVLAGQAGGSIGAQRDFYIGGFTPYGMAVGDLNSDGRPDVVMANLNSSNIGVLLNYVPAAPAATAASRCGSGPLTLQASGAPSGGSYRWYTVATGGTPISGATGSSYTTPTLYASATYYVSALDSNGTESTTRTPVSATVTYAMAPGITAGGPTTFNVGGSVALTAKPNLALSFNGSSQYVATSLNAAPSALPTTTWEAWVYPTRTNFAMRQVLLGTDDGGWDRSVLIEANTANFAIFTGTGTIWQPATADLNTWQHIAVVYTPNGIVFYKNGVEYTYSGPFTPSATTNPFHIGHSPAFGEYFQGQLDEVRVWNTQRTLAQVQAAMFTALPGSTAGLAGYWRFNEGSGTVAGNEAGSPAGTLTNAPAYVTPGQSSILPSTYAWSPAAGLSATNTATVTASPSATTTYSVSVTAHNGCSSSASALLTVNQPQLAVTQSGTAYASGGTAYAYASRAQGSTSPAVAFTLTNAGPAPLTISGISSTGDFAISSGAATTTIAANGGTATVNVTFTPTAAGTRPGTLLINSNAEGTATYTVNLSGTGLPLPTISGFTPANGPVGRTLTISGTELSGATAVRFNGGSGVSQTTITANTATSLQVTVPAGASSGTVSVTTAGGTATSATAFNVLPAAGALALGGSNDFVSFGSGYSRLPSGNADFTLEMWYYNPGGLSGDRWLAWWGSVGANTAAIIGYDGTTGQVKFNHYAVGNDLTSSVVLPVGQWSHLAVAYRGAARQADIFLNGVYSETLTYSAPLNLPVSGSFQLGTFNSQPQFSANGTIDEVRVWNSALCAAQLQSRMGCGLSGSETGLRAYFSFSNSAAGSGGDNPGLTTLADLSGGASGTLSGFALSGSSSNWVAQGAAVSGSCGAAATCPAPTLTAVNPSADVVGASVSLTGTNLTGLTAVLFNGTRTTALTVTSPTTATVAVPNGATTGQVLVSGPNGTTGTGPVFTVMQDLVVSGTTNALQGSYRNVTITGTGAATLSGALTISGTLLVQAGGSLDQNCRLISGPGSFTLQAGATLRICDLGGLSSTGASGAVQVSGLRSLSDDASYIYDGNTGQVTGNGLPATVRSLTMLTSGTLELTQPLAVRQVLRLGADADGNRTDTGSRATLPRFDLNGQALTLLSDASGTALVVNQNGAEALGSTATVQRHLTPANPGLGYRHYSSPVSGNTLTDLATPGFTPVFSAAYNSSAAPGSVAPFPNVFAYDQSRLASAANNLGAFDKGWYSPVLAGGIPAGFETGRGYTVNLPGTAKVDFTGELNNGDIQLGLQRNAAGTPNAAEAGWALVGNPYPAPLDWSLVDAADRAGLDASMYVFESSSQYGGQYRSYINGIGNPLLAAGQGFFVRVSAGEPVGTLTFRNTQRLTSFDTQVAMSRGTADTRPRVQLTLQGAGSLRDELYLYAEAGATAGLEGAFDAAKLPNTTGLNLSAVAAGGELLAIQGLSSFAQPTVVPLLVQVPAAGRYSLSAPQLLNLPAGTQVVLVDNLTGARTDLRTLPATGYAFTASATGTAGRFYLNLTPQAAPLAVGPALSAATVSLLPNPARHRATVLLPAVAGARSAALTLTDALGRTVQTHTLALSAAGGAATLNLDGLTPGVYLVHVQASAEHTTLRLLVE